MRARVSRRTFLAWAGLSVAASAAVASNIETAGAGGMTSTVRRKPPHRKTFPPLPSPGSNPSNAFDTGMTYTTTDLSGVGDPTGVSDSYSALQAAINAAANGSSTTSHRRFLFPAGATYKLSHSLDLDSKNHCSFEGQGTETTYAHTGGARLLSTNSTFTDTASSIFRVTSGQGTRPLDLRFHGLTLEGGSTNYSTVNAGDGGEVQFGWGLYSVDTLWIDHCVSQKNKGDGIYFGHGAVSGTGACKNLKVTHSTIQQNGRMGIALISADTFTGQYIDFENICYTPIDYEPNTGANEGAWGNHLWENCKFGDYSWDSTFDQPMVDIAPHDSLNVFAMNLTIQNCTKTGHDKNSPSKPNLTSVFRMGSGFDTVTRSGTLIVQNNTDTSGGEAVGSTLYGVMDLYHWSGAISVTNNTGFKASGTNWIKDRGSNGTITASGNT